MLMQQPQSQEDQKSGRQRIACAARKFSGLPSTPITCTIFKKGFTYFDRIPEEGFIFQAVVKERSGLVMPKLQGVKPKGKIIH